MKDLKKVRDNAIKALNRILENCDKPYLWALNYPKRIRALLEVIKYVDEKGKKSNIGFNKKEE